jgi:hypothetical protein
MSELWSFFRELLIGPHNSTSELVAITALNLIFVLVELPLPVLLVLLYRTGTRPALSRNLRLMAATLVVIRGAAFLFGIRDVWRAGIPPDVSRVASLAGSQSWFFVSPASHWWTATLLISNVVSFASGLAFIFFLVALACQRGPSQNADKLASRQVRNAALAAIIARAFLIFVLLISFQVYAHAMRIYGPPETAAPGVLFDLRRLLFELPGLIAPLIILVSIKSEQRINSPAPPSVADPTSP